MPLFLLLVVVPIIEIALFIEIGGWIGLWPTIAIVILTAMAGTVLLRAQGLAALSELQRALQKAENPAPALAHGALILVAGVLLLTPGFFTDGIGLALLVPPVRGALIRWLGRRVTVIHMRRAGSDGAQARPCAGPRTVDGEYEEVSPEEKAPEEGSRSASGWTRVPDKRTGG